jgi:hypothetical protein
MRGAGDEKVSTALIDGQHRSGYRVWHAERNVEVVRLMMHGVCS